MMRDARVAEEARHAVVDAVPRGDEILYVI